MELRVWVDGTQRVVCGVKLTTTCQEIVFALAHATQQAGRFTMIERWRNNERLLSPNEQPLVTLQRWGDHMNEVEFILRKTSSDPPPPQQATTNSQHQAVNNLTPLAQAQPNPQPTNNHQIDDLYSTINKRRFNQPPVVPAKPRVMNPLGNVPITQNIYKAQMNYYHLNQSPASMCSNSSLRPRHPPGYLDYMEALANRNSLPQLPTQNHVNHRPQQQQHQQHQQQQQHQQHQQHQQQQPHHNQQNLQSNIFPPRTYDPHQPMIYDFKQNNSSPITSTTSTMAQTSNKFGYPTNGQIVPNNGLNHDLSSSSSRSFSSPINGRLIESGLVINRGSAVNIKLASNSQTNLQNNNRSKLDERLDTSSQSNSSLVSQIGHDMLKVIEEQKRLLINQKNELEKLNVDQDYWDAQQDPAQSELINRIESEIRQLEELWKENQTQIDKLEKQDFAGLLEKLKAEQIKMEDDIEAQKMKLAQCESDIAQCKQRIDLLEDELTEQGSTSSDDVNDDVQVNEQEQSLEKRKSKDVAYVDKRGLISGIRSLKLDQKSRSINRQLDLSPQICFNDCARRELQ